MKNKFLFYIIFLFLLIFLSDVVTANSIYPVHGEDGEDKIKISYWSEKNVISNLDLFTEITLSLEITKDSDTANVISLNFNAGEFVSSNKNKKPAEGFNVVLCKDSECGKMLNSAIKFYPVGNTKFKEYQINISQKELGWGTFHKVNLFYLKIMYTIPNYIQSENIFSFIPIDPDKTLIIGTGCSGNDFCPNPDNVYKQFILPERIILKGYSDGGETFHSNSSDGRLGLYWGDFTKNKSKNDYKGILIQYTDLKVERKLFFFGVFLSAILGALLGSSISFFINHHYYNKSKKDNEVEISKLKQKLGSKLSTINFNKKYETLSNRLGKLNNLMESKKRKSRKQKPKQV